MSVRATSLRASIALSALLLMTSAKAQAEATFRCDADGKISYSDVACPGGKVLPAADLRAPATVQAESHAAQQRAQADKKQLLTLEENRQKEEHADRKARQHALNVANAQRRKCDALALRKKWLDDEASASHRVSAKAKRKSQRLAEQHALQCQA